MFFQLIGPVELYIAALALELPHTQVASLVVLPVAIRNKSLAAKIAGKLLLASMGSHVLEETTLVLKRFWAPVENTRELTVGKLNLFMRVSSQVSLVHVLDRDTAGSCGDRLRHSVFMGLNLMG